MSDSKLVMALWIRFGVLAVGFGAGMMLVGMSLSSAERSFYIENVVALRSTTRFDVVDARFEAANARLKRSQDNTEFCDCVVCKFDRPQWYAIADIVDSVDLGSTVQIQSRARESVERRHEQARVSCSSHSNSTSTGGYCLECISGNGSWPTCGVMGHAGVAPRIVTSLQELILASNATSISDFGAGIGQYKRAIMERLPFVQYNAYDGAGNVVEFTRGYLSYFDLALPLALPKTDWVISFEVGEHIPNSYEGMVIRNLHYHNCKGLVLSWGVIGQGGRQHINCHSNAYLVNIFAALGYEYDSESANKFRQPEGNHKWFVNSLMVFRRKRPVC